MEGGERRVKGRELSISSDCASVGLHPNPRGGHAPKQPSGKGNPRTYSQRAIYDGVMATSRLGNGGPAM